MFALTSSFFTTWATGILNGYTLEKGGLPTGIKYTTLGISSGIGIIKVLSGLPNPIPRSTPISAIFWMPPLLAGSTFCVGNQLGKAIRFTKKIEG